MSRMKDLEGRKFVIILIPLFLILLGSSLAFGALSQEPGRIPEKVFRIQMPFIANEGQIGDEHVRFYAPTFAGTVYVTDKGEMVYLLSSPEPKTGKKNLTSKTTKTWMIKEKLVGASKTLPEGKDRAATKVNYFIGDDKNKWRTDIATYNSVSLGEVYPGVELQVKAYGKRAEKIFTVKPGADPRAINAKIEGAKSLKLNEKGELEIETGLGKVRYSKPLAYQERNGKIETVQVAYNLRKNTYGFRVSHYDATLPLVIDPFLAYFEILEGAGDDFGNSIAVDIYGCAYVTGETFSTDFPTAEAFYSSIRGASDAFVTKLSPSGSVLFSTYLGGNGNDEGNGIALDYGKSGTNIYVVGSTSSTDLPSRLNAKSKSLDAFVIKLDERGVVFSRYIGGSADDEGFAIAVGSDESIYVTGTTKAQNFPVLNAYKQKNAGSFDAFVTKLTASGALSYSTYLGGSSDDCGYGIAVDSAGSAYVTGYTYSTKFPTTSNAYQLTNSGGSDAFVTKFSAQGSSVSYSTYLGGSGFDQGHGIALGESSGNIYIYVIGETSSESFPTRPNVSFNGGTSDAFITKIDPSKSGDLSLAYSTYLGGSGEDKGYAIAVDDSGSIYATGKTNSTQTSLAPFPITLDADQPSFGGGASDAFITKLDLNPSGAYSLGYSTYLYLGGSGEDQGFGIAAYTKTTDCGNVWTAVSTGYTFSSAGNYDAFVAKFSNDCDDCPDDPDKTEPGICGCGTPDTDSDNDGTPDCNDLCPADPFKTAPGTCGCGVADTDSDGDGTPNCNDLCPADPFKTAPGICGCGVADTDSDGDGTPNCNDLCPADPFKTAPGTCGCGVADTDSDGDGTPDCNDQCPLDPLKTLPGICGCGVADTDSDGDGTPNCNDLCPTVANADQKDFDGDKVGDVCDNCPDFYNIRVDSWEAKNGTTYHNSQPDFDLDGIGDDCDCDADDDSYISAFCYSGNDCDDLDPDVAPGECGIVGLAPKPSTNPSCVDTDGDAICDADDNCPTIKTSDRTDSDVDGVGDACDNCPTTPNPDQKVPVWYKDTDGDGHSDGTTVTQCTRPMGYWLINELTETCTNEICVAQALLGDCNDDDANVYPGAPETLEDGIDNDCNASTSDERYEVVFYNMTVNGIPVVDYDTWYNLLPNAHIAATAVVRDNLNQALITPNSITLTVLSAAGNPTNYTGRYTNDINTDSDPDFTGIVINGPQVGLTSEDFGGSIAFEAEVPEYFGSTKKIVRLPRDCDGDGLPDAWEMERFGTTRLGAADDPDKDGLVNLDEYRGVMWTKLLRQEPNTTYKTPAYIPENTITHFRTDPMRRDLFVKFIGFTNPDYPFVIGEAYDKEGIDVHAVSESLANSFNQFGATGLGDAKIDVLSITLSDITFLNEAANIWHRSIRDWTFKTLGTCGYGSETTYGSCTMYQPAWNAYFNNKPYVDQSPPGTAGKLDRIDTEGLEDKKDNGGTKGQDDDRDKVLDGDHAAAVDLVNGGPPWVYDRNLSPFDIDNDGQLELPVASNPDAINTDFEYTKAQIFKHVLTHEIGHGVGVTFENEDPTCVMHKYSNNWSRDNHFSTKAAELLRIHNQ